MSLREAAQQALEALEYENSWHAHHKIKPYASTIDAIIALKAALEQHEKDVEWMKQRHANWRLQKVDEETADAWRKRWGHLWGRKV